MLQLCQPQIDELNDGNGHAKGDYSHTFANVRRINTIPRSPENMNRTETLWFSLQLHSTIIALIQLYCIYTWLVRGRSVIWAHVTSMQVLVLQNSASFFVMLTIYELFRLFLAFPRLCIRLVQCNFVVTSINWRGFRNTMQCYFHDQWAVQAGKGVFLSVYCAYVSIGTRLYWIR